MKRAIFTLFQHPRWLLLRRLFMVFILTWGFLGAKLAQAQIAIAFSEQRDTATKFTLLNCNGEPANTSTLFTDDNTNDGNYADSRARKDTFEICPVDNAHYVKLSITDFDLEIKDTLFVYDGNKKAFGNNMAPVIGTGTGVGVSRGFGGWLDASCDPTINPSGCLTFVFQTDGTNSKGKGWEAWVDCGKKDISLSDVTIESKVLSIHDRPYAPITIPAPLVKGCGETFPTSSDSVRLLVKNQLGIIQLDTVLTRQGVRNSIRDTFAIGLYSAEYALLSDPTKQLIVPFSVQSPTLACNDNVIVPFGSACALQIKPDDILESPADTLADTMYYNITVMLGTGKNQIVKTTQNYDNHNRVIYPSITAEDIKNAGMDVCSGTATVMIQRIYYQLGGTATIYDSGVQNAACQTTITFEDKSQPFISVDNSLDTLIACDTTGLFALLQPRGIDNCTEEVPVTISVEMEEKDPCYATKGSRDTTKAIITFTAIDACGNIGKTTREVVVIRPDEFQHVVKTEDLTLNCDDTTTIGQMPGLQIGALKNGQFIVRDTIPLSTEEYVCGFILTKREVEIPTTDCGRKLYRYWSIVDWCNATTGPVAVDTQLVKYTDLDPPSFDNKMDSVQAVTIGAFECTYDITQLTVPTASDNCAKPTVRLDSVFRIEDGLPWAVATTDYTQLDADSFLVRWIAADDCHEQLTNDTMYQMVLIKDNTRPTAVCTDQLNISIGSNAAIISTEDIDAGSYDACGILKQEISRDGINFGPTVTFTCDDVKDTIAITYRVTDKNGNTNSCWLQVIPEDKIRPICTAFPIGKSYANGAATGTTDTVIINCNDHKVKVINDRGKPTIAELAAIGGALPAPKDNCPNASNVELTPLVLTNEFCGKDRYLRRWIARDIWGLESPDTCTQLIMIENVEDWEIYFPEDVSLTCPMTPVATDSIIIKNGSCDRIAVNVDSKMYDVVEDACFKVVKTYHIINWCNYEPGSEPTHTFSADNIPESGLLTEKDLPNLSYITYTQVIKVNDNDGPIIIVADDVDTCITGVHDGIAETVGDSMACGEIKTFTAFAGDCVTQVGGTLSHAYKLYQGTEADVIAKTATLVHESNGYIKGNDATMSAFVLPGIYTAEFIFSDNCGNTTVGRQEYTFIECKKPTPYLLNGIAIELSNGWIDVWANDFNQGSYDNCTPQDSLDFRIWHISLGTNPPNTVQGVKDSLPTSIRFTCDYLGTQVVRIYVVDQSDNFDYAATFVVIQDNMRYCQNDDNENMIAGEISNFNGESIENVTVRVEGSGAQSMTTATDGHYQFMLSKNGNYTVTPQKNDDPLNGVSTFDLVLISKHILGLSTFDSPYKYIAADVNKSGTITAFDMVQLRQMILNVHSEFPNNQSWRFMDKNYVFKSSTPMDEQFAETITVQDLSEDLMQKDFIGVKIGDVNGNASPSSLVSSASRQGISTFKLQVNDESVKAGQVIKVPIKSTMIEDIDGYQFTLDFVGLELVNIEDGVLTAENFNTTLPNKHKLAASWNGTARENEVLFTLNFKAKIAGNLRDLLHISSDYTKAEAYHKNGTLMQVGLDFQATNTSTVFQLDQNAPNPFKNETVIGFILPESSIATLKIMDIQGKTLKTVRGYYHKGYNQISLNAKSLNTTGVLYYQLEAGNHIANKKMIIIE